MEIINIIKESFTANIGEILIAVATAVFAFLGTAIEKVLDEFVKDKEKKEIVKNTVKSVEQMYKGLKGTEKLQKAMENASEMLCDKGINITDLELMTLIEAAVCEFNDAFNKASWKEGLDKATSGESDTDITVEDIEVEQTAEEVG